MIKKGGWSQWILFWESRWPVYGLVCLVVWSIKRMLQCLWNNENGKLASWSIHHDKELTSLLIDISALVFISTVCKLLISLGYTTYPSVKGPNVKHDIYSHFFFFFLKRNHVFWINYAMSISASTSHFLLF